MKKLLLPLFLFVSLSIYCQRDSTIMERRYYEQNKGKSEVDYKTGWIRYNLSRFYEEQRASQICGGIAAVSGSIYMLNPQKNTAFLYIGGLAGLIGFAIHIDSYTWIRRASIEPTLNGISVKIKLK